jgi:ribonuclease P protein component
MAREQAAGVPGTQLLVEIDGLWQKLLANRPVASEPLKRADDTTTIVR